MHVMSGMHVRIGIYWMCELVCIASIVCITRISCKGMHLILLLPAGSPLGCVLESIPSYPKHIWSQCFILAYSRENFTCPALVQHDFSFLYWDHV